jgi:hemoglobin
MSIRRYSLLFLLAGSFLVTSSCSKDDDDNTTPVAEATLYDRLGKVAGVSTVVDTFLGNVVAETQTPTSKLKRTFQPLLNEVGSRNPFEVPRVILLRNNLIDQIGQAAGGPLIYKGKPMPEAHRNMRITDDEFNALVAALGSALTTNNVPQKEQGELVAILGGLKGTIVNQ